MEKVNRFHYRHFINNRAIFRVGLWTIGNKSDQQIIRFSDSTEMLFTNKQSRPLTSSGIAYILRKHSDSARIKNPQIFGTAAIHPHVLRHSKAMHLLESGVNLIYIRDFFGHSSVITTEIYAKANPEIKRKYLESAASNIDISVNK